MFGRLPKPPSCSFCGQGERETPSVRRGPPSARLRRLRGDPARRAGEGRGAIRASGVAGEGRVARMMHSETAIGHQEIGR
ncbi:hypothetical protein B1812_09335 [Methylocystis bryophila]|uniref:Uncharacterized protein n=1 Tax=Methylocystis bryophila TaxID=655015 RepID=A0A1W6MUK2_9HYPH|nr:hypothetical protein B1812_09335 [Methylocystis bryophila]